MGRLATLKLLANCSYYLMDNGPLKGLRQPSQVGLLSNFNTIYIRGKPLCNIKAFKLIIFNLLNPLILLINYLLYY